MNFEQEGQSFEISTEVLTAQYPTYPSVFYYFVAGRFVQGVLHLSGKKPTIASLPAMWISIFL